MPGLGDCLFGGGQRELGEPVIKAHLLAVEPPFSFEPANLPADA